MAISNLTIRASSTAVTNLIANVDSNISIKGSPLSHEQIDLNFLELAESIQSTADQNPLQANLDANTFSILNAGTLSADTLTGNLTGSVIGDTAGTHTGAVIGNVTGNVTGNVNGDVTGTVSSLSNHDTDSLAEGSANLYYTDSRVENKVANIEISNIAVNAVTTTELDTANIDISNFTDTGNLLYRDNLSNNTTDDLPEGTTNFYYTDTKVDNRVANIEVSNIAANAVTTTELDTANIDVGDFVDDGTYVKYTNITRELDLNSNDITSVANIDANVVTVGSLSASDANIQQLIVSQNSTISGNLDVTNDIFVTGNVQATGRISSSSEMIISADGQFDGNVVVQGDLRATTLAVSLQYFLPTTAGSNGDIMKLDTLSSNTSNDVSFTSPALIGVGSIESVSGGSGNIALDSNATTLISKITATGDPVNFTLADGVEGQQKTVVYSSNSGGSYQPTVEPSTFANGSTITLNNQGSTVVLTFIDTIGWCITGSHDITVI
jgi:hypothetical protein